MSNFLDKLDQLSPLAKTLIILGTLFLMLLIVGTIMTRVVRPKNKTYLELQKEVVAEDQKAKRISKSKKPGRWG